MAARRTSGPSQSSALRATAVVLEDIRAQNKLVLEAVQGLGQKLERDLEQLRSDLGERIARLEDAVREHSRRLVAVEDRMSNLEHRMSGVEERLSGVEHRMSGVEERLSGVEEELRSVKQALNARANAAALAALELRVTALEERLGR